MWQIDVDEHIPYVHSRINPSIATDCRTIQSHSPSSTEYNCTWPKRPAISCYLLIDSVTYMLIEIYSAVVTTQLRASTLSQQYVDGYVSWLASLW